MKCPKCNNQLAKEMHMDIEVDRCGNCKGMWLDFEELDQLEDNVFDQDELKGTTIFSSMPTEFHCPHCNSQLKQFRYRLHDLELEFCENKHGFWLDENEEERVLDLMKKSAESIERTFQAEENWTKTLNNLRSRSFFSKMMYLFNK